MRLVGGTGDATLIGGLGLPRQTLEFARDVAGIGAGGR